MRTLLLALLLAFAASPAAAASDRDEKRAVVAAVQEFFDALAAKDEARLMAGVVPEGTITATRTVEGKLRVRTQSWREWAKGVAGANEALLERMYSPKVRLRRPVASLWAEYGFWRDGKFSHCGVDVVDLVKVDGRWKLLNVAYTYETDGCRRK
jgi:hypothetical protein